MLDPVEEETARALRVGLQPGGAAAQRLRQVAREELLALDDVRVGVDRAV